MSVASGSSGGQNGDKSLEKAKIPFQWQSFADFVALIGRLFYDDACIVLLDFLAREQRAFLESDLREKLGWREALVQQKLYLLEKHMLLIQDSVISRGSRPTVYWRINHNIHAAVQFRYQQLVNRLTRLVEDATRQHEFECSKPGCPLRYTALEAACCVRSLDDEHPLCTRCGSPLQPSVGVVFRAFITNGLQEFEATRNQAKEKCARALHQLAPLRQELLRVANMEIPVFKAYTKDEKKEEMKEKAATEATRGPATASQVDEPARKHLPSPTTPPPAKRLAVQSSTEQVSALTVIASPSPTSTSRVIPWFDGSKTSSAPPAVKQASPTKISFGLKAAAKTSTTPLFTRSLGAPIAGVASVAEPQPDLSPISTALAAAESVIKSSTLKHEASIYVQRLNRQVKLSEVTEEIEQMMTDEEYTAFYNASEPQL